MKERIYMMNNLYYPPPSESKSILWGFSIWEHSAAQQDYQFRKFIPSYTFSLHIPLKGNITYKGINMHNGMPFLIYPSDKPFHIGYKTPIKLLSLFFVPMALGLELNKHKSCFFTPGKLKTRYILDKIGEEINGCVDKDAITACISELAIELYLLFNKPHVMFNSSKFNCSNLLYGGYMTDKTQLHFCERHFRRKFKLCYGLTPVKYCRLQRFQHLLKLKKYKALSIFDLVAFCGYYDHAHLTHEFKEFTGFSPREYFKATDHNMDLFLPYVQFGAPNEADSFWSEADKGKLKYLR